ncbi:hypothetical protein GOP47_0009117 [Adiantum capillus-veneris]|uniref:Uncharacterized protein n=1 Tax=Adiantum capillus-veneris TaxID=13818 RepID=A0A9D4V130_ADICA|nr:hypothetical protein GOP47_0009117 [Adiantum capillus-veneris]
MHIRKTSSRALLFSSLLLISCSASFHATYRPAPLFSAIDRMSPPTYPPSPQYHESGVVPAHLSTAAPNCLQVVALHPSTHWPSSSVLPTLWRPLMHLPLQPRQHRLSALGVNSPPHAASPAANLLLVMRPKWAFFPGWPLSANGQP